MKTYGHYLHTLDSKVIHTCVDFMIRKIFVLLRPKNSQIFFESSK